MLDKDIYPGKYVMVFDSRLWNQNGGDSEKDNFFRRARIVKIYRHISLRPDAHGVADVKFEHDGRISQGHFVYMQWKNVRPQRMERDRQHHSEDQ